MPMPKKKNNLEALLKKKINVKILNMQEALILCFESDVFELFENLKKGFGIETIDRAQWVSILLTASTLLASDKESVCSAIVKAIHVTLHEEIVDKEINKIIGETE